MTDIKVGEFTIGKNGAMKGFEEMENHLRQILTTGKNVSKSFEESFNGKKVKELANALKEVKLLLNAISANPGADLKIARDKAGVRDLLAGFAGTGVNVSNARGRAQKAAVAAQREDQIDSYLRLNTPEGGKLSSTYIKQLQDINELKKIEEALERRMALQRDKDGTAQQRTTTWLKDTRAQKEAIAQAERDAAKAARETAKAERDAAREDQKRLNARQQLSPLQRIQQGFSNARARLQYQYDNRFTPEAQQDLAMKAELAQQQRAAQLSGAGGAGLLAIQARLIANYALLNTFTRAIRFSATSVVELDGELKQLQAITAATSTEMGTLTNQLTTVATATKFTGTEIAQAATTLGQAGLSAAQIGQAIEPIAKFASAVGTDLNTAVDVTTTTISAFNMQWSETPRVTDMMTTALNKSKLSMGQLQLALSYVSNTASQVNVPLEELTTAIGLLANAGVRSGSTIGTGLNQLLIEFANPSENFKEQLKLVGLNIEDVDVRSKGLVGTLKTLKEAGFGVTEGLKSFDVRSARSFAALLNQLGNAEDFQSSLNDIGSTAKANAIQMESLTNKLANLASAFTAFSSEAGAPFLELTKGLVDVLISITQWAGKAPEALKLIGGAMTAVASGVFAGWLVQISTGLIKTTGLIPLFRGAMMSLGMIAPVLDTVAVSATAASTAVSGLGTAVSWISRLTLLTAVVVGFGEAIYALSSYLDDDSKRLDQAQAAVNELSDAYKANVTTIDSLGQAIDDVALKSVALNDRTEGLNNGQKMLDQTTENLANRFSDLGKWIGVSSTNAQDLINKLRELRGIALDKALLNLDNLAGASKNLENEQRKNIQDLSGSTGAWSALRGIDLTSFGVRTLSPSAFSPVKDIDTSRATDPVVKAVVDFMRIARPISSLSRDNISAQEDTAMRVYSGLQDRINSASASGNYDQVGQLKELETAFVALMNSIKALGGQIDNTGKITQTKSDLEVKKTEDWKHADDLVTTLRTELAGFKVKQAGTEDASTRYSLFSDAGSKSTDYKARFKAIEAELAKLPDGPSAKELKDALATLSSDFKTMEKASLDDYLEYLNRFRKVESDANNRKLQEIKSRINKTTNAKEILAYQKEAEDIINAEWRASREQLQKKLEAENGPPDRQSDLVKAEIDGELKNLDAAFEARIKDSANQYKTALEATRGNTLPFDDQKQVFKEQIAQIDRTYKTSTGPSDAAVKAGKAQIDAATNDVNRNSISSVQVWAMQKEQYKLETDALAVQKEALQVRLQSISALLVEAKARADAARIEADQQNAIVNSYTSEEDKARATAAAARATSLANSYTQKATDLESDLTGIRQKLVETTDELAARTDKIQPMGFVETYKAAMAQWREEVGADQTLTTRFGNALPDLFKGVSDSFTDMTINFAKNSKTIGESAKNMSLMVVEALLKIAAQQAVSGLASGALSLFGSIFGSGSVGSTAANVTTESGLNFTNGIFKRHGGPIRRARGGSVLGKIKTRDSVHTLLQPDEYVLQKSAVDAIGIDTLDYLNANAADLSQRSGSSMSATGAGLRQGVPPIMQNVYVVLPEEKPQIGPNDILTVVNDDLRRGGTTKQLVKQVVLGR